MVCPGTHNNIYNICVFRFASGCALRLDQNKGTEKLNFWIWSFVSVCRLSGATVEEAKITYLLPLWSSLCLVVVCVQHVILLHPQGVLCCVWSCPLIIAKVRFYLVVVCFVSRVWSFIHIHILYIYYIVVWCVSWSLRGVCCY